MMIEVCNGIYELQPGDIETLFPKEMLDIPAKFYAPYGFKLVEIRGEMRWQPGTFEEYASVVARIKGIDESQVERKTGDYCHSIQPTDCEGGCIIYGACYPYYYGQAKYVFCFCRTM